jgi:hypothetical protein
MRGGGDIRKIKNMIGKKEDMEDIILGEIRISK